MKYFLFSVLCIYASHLKAQKIKLKLELQDSVYKGKMTPKWFETISLQQASKASLVGATGQFSGERFGEMQFSIDNNKTGTSEPLMLRTNNGWYPLTYNRKGNKLNIVFNWGFRPKPGASDIKVIRYASNLLQEETWNPKDDRVCEDDFRDNKWSLYCLLKQAYLDVTDDFNHRAAGLNEVRSNIIKLDEKRHYEHELMDYNNEQSFDKIQALLHDSIITLEMKLNK